MVRFWPVANSWVTKSTTSTATKSSPTVVAGAIVVEIVFGYPGLGLETYNAVINRDYFLLQGIFLFIIVGVLIANFLVDIAYVIVDPRTRTGLQGS